MKLQTKDPIVIYEDLPDSEVLSMLKEAEDRHNPLKTALIVIVLIVAVLVGIRVISRVLKLMA